MADWALPPFIHVTELRVWYDGKGVDSSKAPFSKKIGVAVIDLRPRADEAIKVAIW